jgi:P27 family predicted phage terminase small subunit
MGRKAVPVQLKLLRGNPGKQVLRDDVMYPDQFSDVPEPPAFITGYACDEWYNVATELHRLGVLTKLDCVPLAAYCYAYGQWRDAAEMLATVRDDPTRGLLIRGALGGAVENPLIYIARKAAADMMKYSAEFGLTPAARSRVAARGKGDGDQTSKFGGLLANG